ncbi:MAG: COX15/CtaA family protein [Acidobacteriota bacterium]
MQRNGDRDRGSVLAIGFSTTVCMWTVGYLGRLPFVEAPAWLLFVLMLACLAAGGIVAGRYATWRAGLWAGTLSAALNLLILGSLLGGGRPNQLSQSAAWWIGGSILLGTALGGLGGAIGRSWPATKPSPSNWTATLAFVACFAALLLIIAGGLVTSNRAGLAVVDWPNSFGYNMFLYPLARMTGGIYYEHAHRLLGTLVGLSTLVLVIHLHIVDSRRWLRRFALAALALVICQGILGGLRVTGRFTLSTSPAETAPSIALAAVHGVVGQVFFGMLVALGVFCTRAWREPRAVPARTTARAETALGAVLVVTLVAQLALGAIQRHIERGLLMHITLGVVVVLLAVACGVRAWGYYTEQPIIRRTGIALLVLTALQVLLGFGALIAVGSTSGIEQPPPLRVSVTTAHQVTGACLLACAIMLTLWCNRLLATPPASHRLSTRPR